MARKPRGKRGVSKKGAEKIARQVAYKMIPKKVLTQDANDFGVGLINNATPWLVIKPASIDQGFNNFTRMGDQVFIEKTSGYFNLSFHTKCTNRVEVRELVGFYKGSTDGSDKAAAAFNATHLATDLPTKMTSWDRDNYYIKHDKKYDLMPRQVYNAGAGNDINIPNGIWASKRIPLACHLYRKFRYTNSTEGGDDNLAEGQYATSNEPVGWIPFIALQVRCPDQDFTAGGSGSNPGPYIDYQFRTTFKDMQ